MQKTQKSHEGGKKSRTRHTGSICSSTGEKQPVPAAFSKAKVSLTGSQRAWESPLALLLGGVWVSGFPHGTGSTAVGLATGPL